MSEIITIPFDPNRSPRMQIETALASLPPRPCQFHAHELCPLDLGETISAALQYRRKPEFIAVFERCIHCPHSQVGKLPEARRCAVALENSGRDESNRPLPMRSSIQAHEPNMSLRESFDVWLRAGPSCWCSRSEVFLPLREASMPSQLEPISVHPRFATCLRCALQDLGITPDDAVCSFDNFDPDPPELAAHLAECREFAANPRGVLLLLGNCGTGKTHLAISILRERMRLGARNVAFVKHRNFLNTYRLAVRPVPFGEEPPENPLIGYQENRLLIYDELTPLEERHDSEDILLDLFDCRLGHHKPTVITSNISRPDMAAAIGARLCDRLRRTALVLEFGFPSRRASLHSEYLNRCAKRPS